MTDCIVETNWILDLILDQHEASVELWRMAQAGRVSLLVPSMCLIEAIKNIERKRGDWRMLAKDVADAQPELQRGKATQSPAPAADELVLRLIEMGDRIEERLWSTINAISQSVRLLPLTPETVTLARGMADSLALNTADALVLAHVDLAKSACSEFVSRDNDFDSPAVRTYLREAGIKRYADPAHFIEAHLR